MSTIRVRRLDANWDPEYGSGVNNYIYDLDAVVQIIETRMRLWFGEWWENLNEGLPMIQKILGKPGTSKNIIDTLIQKRIIGTPYVRNIQSFSSTYVGREYVCTAIVNTEFGTVTVTNA